MSDEMNIDYKALLNEKLITEIGTENPEISEFLQTFQKYGLDIFDSFALFMELEHIRKKYEEKEGETK